MKHIGIIGGLSPESTVSYYQLICAGFNKQAGGLNFPTITIRSVNLQQLVDLFNADRWDEVANHMVAAISDLQKSGAEFAAISANTPHNAYEQISARAALPVLSIMDATARAIAKDGLSRVGLLGTKATMEYGFFQKVFARHRIETVVPEGEERQFINQVIWEELSHGEIKEQSKVRYLQSIERLIRAGAQGIVLGCTEIPLLIRASDISVPCYDTTAIHAAAILEHALERGPA
jgi:aspartate racemase